MVIVKSIIKYYVTSYCPDNVTECGKDVSIIIESVEINYYSYRWLFNFLKQELNAREDFSLQLVQLKGMSSDKAWAITEVYPTPKCLIEGFLYSDAEKVISELRSGLMRNKIGPQIASVLRTFYTSKEFTGWSLELFLFYRLNHGFNCL